MSSLGARAVVIGGSMTGMTTARVLSEHFDNVTVLERDAVPDRPASRKSVPQGDHYHALLLGGQRVLSELFPGFTDRLEALGAVKLRAGVEAVSYTTLGKSYMMGGAMVDHPVDLGFDMYSQSRGLIEHCVREFASKIDNVELEQDVSVAELIHENGRVCGVRGSRGDDGFEMRADLVVDTGGRGSRALRWLRELGFEVPSETTLGVDFAYASTKLEIPDDYVRTERLCVFISPPPEGIRGALLGEIENDTWHLSVAGRFGEYPPADPDGLMAFVRSLPVSRLYDLVKGAERVAEIAQYRFPTSIQRRFHELSAFPENFLVLGDAICSFNPVYGQGMSSGALQARELRGLLAQRADGGADTRGLALEFFPRAADVILTPWSLAAAQDLAFPQTSGERPENQEEMGRYLAALGVLAARDPEVMRLLMEVFHLARHIRELAEEPLLSRVLAVQGELASGR